MYFSTSMLEQVLVDGYKSFSTNKCLEALPLRNIYLKMHPLLFKTDTLMKNN